MEEIEVDAIKSNQQARELALEFFPDCQEIIARIEEDECLFKNCRGCPSVIYFVPFGVDNGGISVAVFRLCKFHHQIIKNARMQKDIPRAVNAQEANSRKTRAKEELKRKIEDYRAKRGITV